MTNPNDPAFTQQHKKADKTLNYGLTKREYFATIMLQGFIAGCYASNKAVQENVVNAIKHADALIAELNK